MTSVDEEVQDRSQWLSARAKTLLAQLGANHLLGTPAQHEEILCRDVLARLALLASEPDILSRLRRLVDAERVFRLVLELRAQELLDVAEWVPIARRAAFEGYQQGMQSARALGVAPPERWPVPAVLLEPMATPVTLVRGREGTAFGIAGKRMELPFPVVLLPWYPVSAFGSLSVIQHEIGHNLDEDLGITEPLRAVLAERLAAASVKPADVDRWCGWCREIVADAFGCLFAGVALAAELSAWRTAFGDEASLATASHPFPSLRVALARELFELFGVDTSGPRMAEIFRAPLPQGTDEGTVDLVARTVLESPLACLQGAALRDLAPDVASEHAALMACVERLGATDVDTRSIPVRLLPSLVRLAALSKHDPSEIYRCILTQATSRSAAVSAPIREQIFLRTTTRATAVPILDEEHDGLKLPPPSLFLHAQNVVFVGATNDGLPELFKRHAGPRKQRIDVFFLSEAVLAGLSGDQQPLSELVKLQRRGREGLTSDQMRAVAERWAIYEFDQPYFFASYWDANQPGGRIHVSSHGWGQNIKFAPSIDHVWSPTANHPERSYRFYLESLNGLYSRARLLASSEAVSSAVSHG